MSFFSLPDRQVIYLLDYLRTGLNGHKYVKQWFDTASVAVDTCFAYDPKRAVVYKDEYMWKIQAATMPTLGIWRTVNVPIRNETFVPVDAKCGLGWFAHIPEGGGEHDRAAWGITFSSNMWFVVKELIEEIPNSVIEKCGLVSVHLEDGELDVDPTETVCGFIAPLTIRHFLPPYTIDDPDDLAQVAINIKLYDSATVAGDGLPGDYQGLTTEVEIEPQS